MGIRGRLNINIRNAAGEQVTVGVDWDHDGQVYVNRGQTTGFNNPYFTNDFSTWNSNLDKSIELRVLVDRSVFDVFVVWLTVRVYRIKRRTRDDRSRSRRCGSR